MSEESIPEGHGQKDDQTSAGRGRQKQKVRIKYRQKVRIKRRPKGYKIKRFWKKNRRNLLSYLVLAILLGATLFMVVQVAKQQIEHKRHEKNQRLKLQ